MQVVVVVVVVVVVAVVLLLERLWRLALRAQETSGRHKVSCLMSLDFLISASPWLEPQ